MSWPVGLKHTDATKLKLSQLKLGTHLSEERKENLRIKCRGWKHSDSAKFKIGLASKTRIFSDKHRLKLSLTSKGRKFSEITRFKLSQKAKERWKKQEYRDLVVRNTMRSAHVKPNKAELILMNLLDMYFPNEWKYVGDGQLIISGKCPDFVNINGKKAIIELFGNYWHQNENPQDRQQIFEPFGYLTLVIWEKELKDKERIISKVKDTFYSGVFGCKN